MITGVDSEYPPNLSQLNQAKAVGVKLWAGYFAGPNIGHGWSQADFDRVKSVGIATLAYCSGWSDPAAIKAQSVAWGVPICLDVEGGIRGDGSWVQGWLTASGAGLYGNLPVHKGRSAAFHVLADYVNTSPDNTWLVGAGSFRPAGPCGWQWHGTEDMFGMKIDQGLFDDAFLGGSAFGAASGAAGGDPFLSLSDLDQAVLIWRVSVLGGSDLASNAPADVQPHLAGIVPLPALKAELDTVKAELEALKAQVGKDLAP